MFRFRRRIEYTIALNRQTLTDLEATVGTYLLRSYGGEQSRSDFATLPLLEQ